MNSSEATSTVRSAQPALELISLARMAPEQARQNLRAILLATPDYFGKITEDSFKAVLHIQQETAYESIHSVAYNPSLEQLQATININQSTGYSDARSNNGSKEYVRFYLSYDDGYTWRDQGLCSINVRNHPGPNPLQQPANVGIRPAMTFCFLQKLPLVRAILSWNSAPPANKPEWTPVWGDVVEGQIQLDEFSATPLNPLMRETNPQTQWNAKATDRNRKADPAESKAPRAAPWHGIDTGVRRPDTQGPIQAA